MDDPGWRDAWRGIWWRMVFPFLQFTSRRERQLRPLILLRHMYLMFLATLVPITLVTFALMGDARRRSSGVPDSVVVGLLIAASLAGYLFATGRIRRQRTEAAHGEAATIVDTYRSSFFLGMAFAQSLPLIGFAVSFNRGEPLYLVLGTVLAIPMYCFIAPTRAHVLRDDDMTRTHGASASLLVLLLTLPPSGPEY